VPKNGLFLSFIYLISLVGSAVLWFRRQESRPYIMLFLILVGFSAFLFVMTMLVGGTRDTAKQLLQFNVLWDAILALAVVSLAGLPASRHEKISRVS
jgi:predicted membrane channel-forming protein YqfA (hemolysin III family)